MVFLIIYPSYVFIITDMRYITDDNFTYTFLLCYVNHLSGGGM